MKINFNPNLYTIKKYNNNLITNSISKNHAQQSTNDVFVKTTSSITFSAVEKNKFNQNTLTKIFDRAYDKVLEESKKDNPFLDELSIQKPQFKYMTDNCPTPIAAYSPQDNAVYLNGRTFEQFNGNLSTLMMKDDDGKISFYKKFLSVEQMNALMQIAKEEGVDAKPFTLSEEEKELYIETFFIHEIRHCIQMQFQLSTEGIGEQEIEGFKRRKEMIDFYKEIGFISDKDPQYAVPFDFIINYKPHTILSQDTKFASSETYKGEKLYWSAKDFTNYGVANEGDTMAYFMRPNEIDAYKFECDYVERKVKQNPDKYSQEFLAFYLSEKKPRYEKGLELLNK